MAERGAGLDVNQQCAVVLAAPDHEAVDPGPLRQQNIQVNETRA